MGDLVIKGSKKAGEPIPGRYIVMISPNATSAQAIEGIRKRLLAVSKKAARAAKRAAAAAAAPAAAAGGAVFVASVEPEAEDGAADGDDEMSRFDVEHVIGAQEGDDEPEGQPDGIVTTAGLSDGEPAAAATPGRGGAGRRRRRPPKGAVLAVSPKLEARAVVRAMASAPGVLGVVQDTVITVAQAPWQMPAPAPASAPAPAPSQLPGRRAFGGGAGCAPASFLAGTVSTPVNMDWPGCWAPGITKVAWFGERCNAYMSGTRWLGMYAFFAANSTLVPGCVRYRSRRDPDPYNVENFGDCGVAPAAAGQLPTRLCQDAPGAASRGAPGEGTKMQGQQPQQQPACIPSEDTVEWNATLESPVKCGGTWTAAATFRGVRCGPGMRWVRWSSITLPEGGKSCRFSRDATDHRWNSQWLGGCGVPPQYNLGMATRVCGPTDGQPPAGAAGPAQQGGSLLGGAAAPGGGGYGRPVPVPTPIPVLESSLSMPLLPPPPPPRSPPPPLPSPPPPSSPPPPPPSPSPPPAGEEPAHLKPLPKVPLAPNEIVHVNMKRIGVVTDDGMVPDFTSLGVAAAIIDTGIDRRHPDLNVVGGKNLCSAETQADAYQDGLGHGTHVAGILGARNNGQGVVGAAPGIPIYSLKVLSSDGTGAASDLLRAYEWLYYNARALGIRVVNLSLTGSGTADDPQCEWTAALARQGITVVAAAGNNKANLMQEAPGACAKALAVTSFTDKDGVPGNDAFSWFSNWLPSAQATEERRRRIVSAPGDNIISTYPVDRQSPRKDLPVGFHAMSGTSMACPHVSGIVARCYVVGECNNEADTEAEKITSFAKEYNEVNPSYGFTGDAIRSPTSTQYFGYAVNAGRW